LGVLLTIYFNILERLVKSFSAHESAILSTYNWENLLYTTAIKCMRIWDLDA